MRISIWPIVLTAFAATACASPPRVFLLDADRLEQSRQLTQNGDESLKPALEKLKHDADKAMSLGPLGTV